MYPHKRHDRFYRGARLILSPFLKRLFRFEAQLAPHVEGPYIVIANHTTDLDALFVAMSFPKQMYFVASEHIFRSTILSRLLVRYLDPIPKQKGGADVSTAMKMIRRLKKGLNIGLFAEGSKSFHGKPCPVVPATGSLVRASGASLITYRLEGGYFTSPRWAHTFRKGRMKGYPVNVYSPAQLSGMTPEEINEAIARDIGEDAYHRQESERIPYLGKRMAQGLQNALYMCPDCKKIGTLKGIGSQFTCTCGMITKIDEMGYLHGGPFSTVDEWGKWQKDQLTERIADSSERELFSDEGQTLFQIHSIKAESLIAKGTLTVDTQAIKLGTFSLPWSQVMGMEVYGKNRVVFSDALGNHYRLLSQTERSGLKYLDVYRIIHGQ